MSSGTPPDRAERSAINSPTSSAGVPIRKTHTKSRTGCSTCKSRRVKCDEQVPICKNCSKGGRVCVYANTSNTKNTTSNEHVDAVSIDFFGLSQRQQEFWLMHQYYTVTGIGETTFTSDPFVPEEFMIYVGQQAIVHDFVQDMVFATVLFHMAYLRPTQQNAYREIAANYQSRSIARFQELLDSPTGDPEALWICGCLIGTNTWATSRLDRVSQLVKPTTDVVNVSRLWHGVSVLPYLAGSRAAQWPFSALATRPVTSIDGERHLQTDVEDAFEKLEQVVSTYACSHQPTDQNAAAQEHEHAVGFYRSASRRLMVAFEAFADKGRSCESLGWPTQVGPGFIALLEYKEPVARLITMCYGVLLHYSVDEKWWAEGLGRSLVEELAPVVSVHGQTWTDMAEWARQRVGLEKSALTHLSLACKT